MCIRDRIFVLPFLAALLAYVAQRSFIFSLDKVKPKFSRINPISNAKQKFGLTGLVQFAKSVLKLLLVSIALVLYLDSEKDTLIGSVWGESGAVAAALAEALLTLLTIACAIFVALGLVDILWQNFNHNRKLRMTHEELKEETTVSYTHLTLPTKA